MDKPRSEVLRRMLEELRVGLFCFSTYTPTPKGNKRGVLDPSLEEEMCALERGDPHIETNTW